MSSFNYFQSLQITALLTIKSSQEMPLCNIVKFVELVNKVMVGDLQRGFPSARVNVGGRSPVVVHKVGNTVHSEPHLPALRQRLLIQQPESGLNYITVKDKSFF